MTPVTQKSTCVLNKLRPNLHPEKDSSAIKKIRLATRILAFNGEVTSCLAYGCQCWTITARNFDRIYAVYNQFLRSMIRNGWACAKSASDNDENFLFKWSTKKLHAVCNTIPVSDFVKSVQRKYLGHLIRCPDNQAQKQLLFRLDKRGFYQKVPLIHQVSKTQNIEKDRL